MLTIFSTPKPFRGHINIIQRNALQSWKLLHPDVEVILFGDDEGAAETAHEFGIRHEPEIRKAEQGTKYLNYIFEKAQQIALHNVVCYVNCDIILPSAFRKAIELAASRRRPFLMVGHRWDTDIPEPVDFLQENWEEQLMAIVSERGKQQADWYIDYFAFSRGLYQSIPPLVIGRVAWDNWLIWKARSLGAAVIQASPFVKAVHQNHDYSYHPSGAAGVWGDELAQRNQRLANWPKHFYTIENAQYRLIDEAIVWSGRHFLVDFRVFRKCLASRFWSAWFEFLGRTRGLRHAAGLRHENLSALRTKLGLRKVQNKPE